MNKSTVYIIGAGSGDPELLTLKAKRILEEADVVLYDRLINSKILDYTRDDVILDYVGKENVEGGKSQDEINIKLKNYAEKYSVIARLKGGDPYLFGRGAEEALYLHEHKINFEVIPGMSALIAVTSYAGIPLTHRDVSSEVHVFTGHGKDNITSFDPEILSKLDGTIVLFMAINNLDVIIRDMIRYGRSESSKLAIIQNGASAKQKITITNFRDYLDKNIRDEINPPAIIVIGNVVNLNKNLNWLNKKPLSGKNIMVTRSKKQAGLLVSKLSELGANVIELPLIKFSDLSETKIDRKLISNLRKYYSAVLFNSGNSINFFFNRLFNLGYDLRVFSKCKIGVVGEGTLREIGKYHIKPDIIPEIFTVNELVKIVSEKINGKTLVITSDISPVNPDEIKSKYNLEIDKLEIYSTRKEEINPDDFKNGLIECDLITFMSSSTVDSFNYYFNQLDDKNILNKIKFVSIGPMTSTRLKKYGFRVDIEADKYSVDGIVDAILKWEE